MKYGGSGRTGSWSRAAYGLETWRIGAYGERVPSRVVSHAVRRWKGDLSVNELARLAGVDHSALHRAVRGDRPYVRVAFADKVITQLGVPFLLDDELEAA